MCRDLLVYLIYLLWERQLVHEKLSSIVSIQLPLMSSLSNQKIRVYLRLHNLEERKVIKEFLFLSLSLSQAS
jgi:hypothetical protein